jgi:hypothetical protein
MALDEDILVVLLAIWLVLCNEGLGVSNAFAQRDIKLRMTLRRGEKRWDIQERGRKLLLRNTGDL